jgi:hypothetical protein
MRRKKGQKTFAPWRGRFHELPQSHYRKLQRCAHPTGLCEKQFLPSIEQLIIGAAERHTTRKIREMDPVSFAFATISMVDICMK